MDSSFAVALVMVVGALLVGAAIVILPMLHRRPGPRGPVGPVGPVGPAGPGSGGSYSDTTDSVMRALALVQQRYAALVREHDELKTRNRELEAENTRLALMVNPHRGR